MSLEKYDTFMDVVATLNMSKTARNTQQAVSGVSYAINKLEEELGVPLFIHSKSGMSLTEEGQRLLPFIRQMLQDRDELMAAANELSQTGIGVVKIGGLLPAITKYMPEIIKIIFRQYPSIHINLTLDSYDHIIGQLNSGKIDLALSGEFEGAKTIKFFHLFDDAYRIIFPTGHPLEDAVSVSIDQLKNESIILPLLRPHDKNFARLISNSNIEKQIIYELWDERTAVAMARNGHGVCIIPGLLIPDSDTDHIPLLSDWPPRTFGINIREGSMSSPSIAKVVRCIQQFFQDLPTCP